MRSLQPVTQRWYSVPLIALLALAGCSGDDGPSEPENGGTTADATVQVVNNSFNPSVAAVPVNGTVLWQWNSAGVEHNVTFTDGPSDGPNSETQGSGTFERTFSTAGEYNYVCTIHEELGMVGTINVAAGATGGGDGGGGGGDYP